MSRMLAAMCLLAVASVLATADALGQPANTQNADYPIAADLYGEPGRYADKSIVIYGLVIETSSKGYVLLQDVSQHPIKVFLPKAFAAKVGDQVLVAGIFKSASVPYVRAKSVVRTKVLGGGGCC